MRNTITTNPRRKYQALEHPFRAAVELDLFAQNQRDVEQLRASPDHELNLGTRLFGAQALTYIRKPRVRHRMAIYQSYQVPDCETCLCGCAPCCDVHDFVTIAVGINPQSGAIERADVGGLGLEAAQIHELAGIVERDHETFEQPAADVAVEVWVAQASGARFRQIDDRIFYGDAADRHRGHAYHVGAGRSADAVAGDSEGSLREALTQPVRRHERARNIERAARASVDVKASWQISDAAWYVRQMIVENERNSYARVGIGLEPIWPCEGDRMPAVIDDHDHTADQLKADHT